jgi:hypothetical protein
MNAVHGKTSIRCTIILKIWEEMPGMDTNLALRM